MNGDIHIIVRRYATTVTECGWYPGINVIQLLESERSCVSGVRGYRHWDKITLKETLEKGVVTKVLRRSHKNLSILIRTHTSIRQYDGVYEIYFIFLIIGTLSGSLLCSFTII